MKLWVAMFVEIANTTDCKPRALGIFESKELALRAVYTDMSEYILLYGAQANTVDINYDKLYADASDCRCEWSIEQVEKF